MIDFTGTGGAVKDLRILRPGYPISGAPPLHTPWKDHVSRFPVVRFLDWTRTNGNRDVTWADRMTPQKRRMATYIAPWETVIDAANALNRDAWINVPVQANDEYVANLATLFRDRLNPNLNVYVEYGNELWNFNIRDVDMDAINGGIFNGATVNRDLAVATPPSSPIRFDGQSDPTTLGFRRVALRLKEISDIWRTVWGSAAMNTRVRPVLAGQMANSFIVSEGLEVIDNPAALNTRPSTVFYAISGAPYIFPAAIPNGDADETPGMTVQQILDGLAAGVQNAPSDNNAYQYLTHAGLGAWYGLKVLAYEAGFDNFGGENIANKRLANLDARIRTICRDLINQWHGFGFEHILWFNAGADSYNTQFGMWPLVEDMAVQATPKNQCIDDILAAALPAVTVGTSIAGPIAGGNYRGSTSPTGPVSGLDSPFGFPGFVEYLLRADVEGTYDIAFTGSIPPGESFRLELNNALVAASVSSTASSVRVALRRGLNAMRIKRASGASFSITSFTFNLVAAQSFTLTVSKVGSGTVTSSPAGIDCGATCAASFSSGASVTLTAVPANGSVFTGWSGGGCTGSGTCNLTVSAAATITATFTAATSTPRMVNIATRMQVLTGENVMIGGFIIGGSAAKTVVVRARGPSLTALGVPGALANPVLQLFSGQTQVAANDNFGDAANATALQASGFAPSNALESAILATLAPGAYTAIVSGAGGGTGVGIIEVFEVDLPEAPLINIATRGQVLTGSDVMIGGFVIQGNGPQTVVVRARGPSLAAAGVANPLANPVLQLFSGQTQIAINDNWETAANAATLQASGFAPSSPLESAILITLDPGAYTAIVTGAAGGTGVGIVEVFAR